MIAGDETKLRIFLCHALEDKPNVRYLYDRLSSEGWIEPWLDERNILPGQEWDTEIELAVENADVVIVFLSNLSIKKEGYVQRELKYILDIALEKPEGTIFIIPLRLDSCKPPRRVRTWQYVDFFPEDQRDATYQRLLQALRVRLDQKLKKEGAKKSPPPDPNGLTVIPSGTKVSPQNWTGKSIPATYAFVGEMGALPNPHFFRQSDGHLSVLVSSATKFGEDFLIDKYAITCRQFSNFLNDLCGRGIVQTTTENGEHQAVSGKHILIVDAFDRWEKPNLSQPWLHAPKPFGVTYQNGLWTPVPESDLLPVTLVTWWGARLYSLWAHEEITDTLPEAYAYLPTPEQWHAAATWDPQTHVFRRYPWGDIWDPTIVNFSGYWSGRNITEDEWQSQWAANSLAYASTRPLPVAALGQNISPVGCVQMLGNTWEWTLSALESRLPIQGGCATSPMEHCQVGGNTRWSVNMPNEYISFRCSYSLRRSA